MTAARGPARPHRPLRIAWDYNTGVYPGAGVARYTRSLVEALTRHDRSNEYTLFYGARGVNRASDEYAALRALVADRRHVREHPINLSPRQLTILWQRLRLPLPLETLIGRHDIVHAPDFVSPLVRQGRRFVTVHDLSFLIVPDCAEPSLVAYLRRAVPRAVRQADVVIAVSETTREDVIRLLGVPPRKVQTVYNGVDYAFRPLPPQLLMRQGAALRARLGLPERFILHVGTLEPRKNLVRLLDAYFTLLASGRAYGHHLVLAGRRGWRCDPIFARVAAQQPGFQQHIHFLDYVHDADLPLLYNLASVFAYPSLYEGFGLPVAEALACGVPTLTAKIGATAEIASDAALLADPLDTPSLAAGLEVLLEDGPVRAHLADAGPRRVARYTWDAAAQQILGLYERET
jgi:glycosyltransferase involved in cell wall biosynthesis